MNLAYYTNLIEGHPDRFRFRNMQVNLLQHIEDQEDHPRNRPYSPSDSDDNSGNQGFPSGSFSEGSDPYFSGEENFDGDQPNLSEAQENTTVMPLRDRTEELNPVSGAQVWAIF